MVEKVDEDSPVAIKHHVGSKRHANKGYIADAPVPLLSNKMVEFSLFYSSAHINSSHNLATQTQCLHDILDPKDIVQSWKHW